MADPLLMPALYLPLCSSMLYRHGGEAERQQKEAAAAAEAAESADGSSGSSEGGSSSEGGKGEKQQERPAGLEGLVVAT